MRKTSKPILHSRVLEEHIKFIQELDHYIETEEYIFVHAGVEPMKRVSESEPYTLMWIRNEFHNGYSGEKVIVFGHTETKRFMVVRIAECILVVIVLLGLMAGLCMAVS